MMDDRILPTRHCRVFHCVADHFPLFCSTLLYYTLLYSIVLYSILLYSILFYFILLYSIIFYYTILYSTIRAAIRRERGRQVALMPAGQKNLKTRVQSKVQLRTDCHRGVIGVLYGCYRGVIWVL